MGTGSGSYQNKTPSAARRNHRRPTGRRKNGGEGEQKERSQDRKEDEWRMEIISIKNERQKNDSARKEKTAIGKKEVKIL